MAKEKKEKEQEKEKGKREFKIVYPLFRDGKLYKIGETVELELTEAEEMKLVGQSLEEVE